MEQGGRAFDVGEEKGDRARRARRHEQRIAPLRDPGKRAWKVRPAARAPTRPSRVESRLGSVAPRVRARASPAGARTPERLLRGAARRPIHDRPRGGAPRLEPGDREEERQLELAEDPLRDPKLDVRISLRQGGAEASPEGANGWCHLAGQQDIESHEQAAQLLEIAARSGNLERLKRAYFPSPARSRPKLRA